MFLLFPSAFGTKLKCSGMVPKAFESCSLPGVYSPSLVTIFPPSVSQAQRSCSSQGLHTGFPVASIKALGFGGNDPVENSTH